MPGRTSAMPSGLWTSCKQKGSSCKQCQHCQTLRVKQVASTTVPSMACITDDATVQVGPKSVGLQSDSVLLTPRPWQPRLRSAEQGRASQNPPDSRRCRRWTLGPGSVRCQQPDKSLGSSSTSNQNSYACACARDPRAPSFC